MFGLERHLAGSVGDQTGHALLAIRDFAVLPTYDLEAHGAAIASFPITRAEIRPRDITLGIHEICDRALDRAVAVARDTKFDRRPPACGNDGAGRALQRNIESLSV